MLIEARNLDVSYGAARVLSGVSLDVAAGEIVTIVGPNGSGKSTLLRALIGAITPTRGTVSRAPGLRIGYVPQKLHVGTGLPLTVQRLLDLPRRVGRTVARAALEAAGVEGVADQQMSSLSGGQFQRVMLARAILGAPQVLILDEPTQGLDQPGSAAFYRQIEAVRARLGCAVVMVSHELHVVMSATDRVICLNGHICCEGTPEVVRAAPEWRELFGTGTGGALALYRHDHDHHHHDHDGHHGRHSHGAAGHQDHIGDHAHHGHDALPARETLRAHGPRNADGGHHPAAARAPHPDPSDPDDHGDHTDHRRDARALRADLDA